MWKGLSELVTRLLKFALLIVVGGAVFLWFQYASRPALPHSVVSGPFVAEVMGTGTLEARVSTSVSPKIAGRIAEVLVDQGDRVESGQLLVGLDDAELQQQVAIAQANLEAAKAALVRLDTDKTRAIVVALHARKQNERNQQVLSSQAISQEEADADEEALAIAEAGLSRADAAIAEGRTELVAAEQTLEYHRARLADTRIMAPFAGLIVRRYRESGDVVVPGSADSFAGFYRRTVDLGLGRRNRNGQAEGRPTRAGCVSFRCGAIIPGECGAIGPRGGSRDAGVCGRCGVMELPTNWAVGQRAEVFIEVARREAATLLPVEFVALREGQPGGGGPHGRARPMAALGTGPAKSGAVGSGRRPGTGRDGFAFARGGRTVGLRPPGEAAMNLASRDIRHNLGRFALTTVGIGLLLMVVMGMGGIYRGVIEDATLLPDRIGADLWIVQRDTRGPFAEVSRVPPDLVHRALAVPGVAVPESSSITRFSGSVTASRSAWPCWA